MGPPADRRKPAGPHGTRARPPPRRIGRVGAYLSGPRPGRTETSTVRRSLLLPALAAAALLPIPDVADAQSLRDRIRERIDERRGQGADDGWLEETIDVGGVVRHYRVRIPDAYRPGGPAVLLLHGGTQSMREVFGSRAGGSAAWPGLADRHGFLLLVPNGTDADGGRADGDDQVWNDLRPEGGRNQSAADDVGFLRALLSRAADRWGVRPEATLLTGASNGGMMAYRMLVEAPDAFAAAVVWVTALPDGATVPRLRRPLPMMVSNGTEDPLILWRGGPTRGRDGRTMPAERSRDAWIAAIGADPARASTVVLPDLDPGDGCVLVRTTYPAGPGGAPLVFQELRGGGHAMPSRAHPLSDRAAVRRLIGPQCRDAEGAGQAWEFFRAHVLDRG
jgi:polyhydroxybutyrate depolymerase